MTKKMSKRERELFSIFLDPGHGGRDPGACGVEAMINLSVAARVAEILLEHEVQCWLSRYREGDGPSLDTRCQMEEMIAPALTVSLHCNAAASAEAQGIEIWTSPGETASDRAATIILEKVAEEFPERRLRTDLSDGDPDKEARFRMLVGTKGPAVLLEMGFLSHPTERIWLERISTHDRMAHAVAQGILAWCAEVL